jgi:hypothetical protein
MLTDTLTLNLRPSKYYLIVSALIYGLCAVLVWSRLDSFWISVAISIAIAVSAITFFPTYILLAKESSIVSITIGSGSINFGTKDGQIKLQHKYCASYQSRYLVIIRFDKIHVPIFKDSIKENSLSSLNRFLNVIL